MPETSTAPLGPLLEELAIRDLGIIDEVVLELGPGLTVLTGETGAGKTMVVSGLELLLGARADTGQVRAGAGRARVETRVRPAPPSAAAWLGKDDDDLVVAREVRENGSRARLGGQLASVSALSAALRPVVEVHGQSETVRLSEPSVQRELLDRSGGTELAAALTDYRDVYRRWRQAADELADLETDERDTARELDRLRFELAEIDAVGPEPGEEEQLDAELRRLEHAETLETSAHAAAAALVADGGARDALGGCVHALRGTEGVDAALDALARRAEGLAAEAQDVALELRAYAESVELDPARLEALRERRAALAGLTRKYGPDAAAVAAYAAEARARVERLAGAEARSAALADEVARLCEELQTAATALTDARRAAGKTLAAAVEGHLAELAMGTARMEVEVASADSGPHGADRVTFLLAANTGEPARPLAKAASGGERSRTALALRLALAGADQTPVLVFDEVDAGIGGQVARTVGEKLARLADGRQVICITHLPQLAAFADSHYLVTKAERDGRTVADVRRLSDDERAAELARMLSGDLESELATRHAAELLADARGTLRVE